MGLNSPRTAVQPADARYIFHVDPDVLVFYAEAFDLRARIPVDSPKIVEIEPALIEASVVPEYRPLYDSIPTQLDPLWTPERSASLAAGRFLQGSNAYSVFAVEFLGNYRHIWAVKRSLPEHAAIVEQLRECVLGEKRITYREALQGS